MTASTDNSRALVDTNVVIYAYDLDDPTKHTIARVLLERLSDQGRLVFSTQVFNEFCSAMMRGRREMTLLPSQIVEILRELEAAGEDVPVTPRLTFRALDAMPRHGLSFWDALIWAAAAEGAASTLYTEDFQNGREIEGIRFVNPFSRDFSVSF